MMSLQQEIDARRAEIRTDKYDMSIGELISLYQNGELDIHPDFQRFFRWTLAQKSRLIESILLGIPIPPIFVWQRSDGVWDVVDGLQRLSTIFEFLGMLQREDGTPIAPLVLTKTKYLRSLEGITWGPDTLLKQSAFPPIQIPLIEDVDAPSKILNNTQRLLIKRAKIGVSIILRESDEDSKYELFQRLNTGGSSLSDQELRNCILVSTSNEMYKWIKNLSHEENFMNCVSLTDRAINERYDMELVLRFIIFRNLDVSEVKNIGDLEEFLTDRMISIATSEDFNRDEEDRYFKGTFELLSGTTGGNSFRKYDVGKSRFTGGFLVSAFEMVALGIGHNLDRIRQKNIDIESKVQQMWQMKEFTEISGSGISPSSRIPKIVPLARRVFQP